MRKYNIRNGELTELLKRDVHAPLYFFILKAASLAFGNSIGVMKMVSVFPTILMAIGGCLFLKKEFSDKAALIFLLVLIASESITRYAIEIRMYSWALFFVTMMAVSAFYFFKTSQKRWWMALLLCTAGAQYTHTYAMVAAAIVYCLLLLYTLIYRKENRFAILLLGGVASIFFLPWLIVVAKQFSHVSGNFWIEPLTLSTILGYMNIIFSTGYIFVNIVFFFLYCAVLVFFLARKNKTVDDHFLFGGLCCAVLLVSSGIILSIVVSPLFYDRYLIPVVGLVWLFFAAQCAAIPSKRIFISLLVALSIMGFTSFLYSAQREAEEHKESNIFYTHITQRLQQDDVFVFDVSASRSHLPFTINSLLPNKISIPSDTTKIDTLAPSLFFSKRYSSSRIKWDPGIYNDRTVWTFLDGFDKDDTKYENIVPSHLRGVFQGEFQYNFYRFRLYRSEPDSEL
ncbi:MAG: hypothetical protein FWC23_00185 [Chitinispirillia bacterium]|nr:hypothetical protein [Chitinispirillia bacterium]MCL2267593.1 hypothetical protein [Chitinispirillia bacterium]